MTLTDDFSTDSVNQPVSGGWEVERDWGEGKARGCKIVCVWVCACVDAGEGAG